MGAGAVRALRVTTVVATVSLAACSTAASSQPAPRTDAALESQAAAAGADAPATAASPSAPWEADPRWRARAAETASAVQSARAQAAGAVGFAFDAGREPAIAYDAEAPAEGDIVVRFVNGVRRPVVRLRPHALLSGEFVVPDDLSPLLASAALLSAAKEHALPEWVVTGGGIVAGGVFDRRVHGRALAGPELKTKEAELFGGTPGDPLAAAARAKALVRIARGERAFTRFVTALIDGRDEVTALALVGVSDRAFLDAATETERAHVASAIADDPALPALVVARAALARGDVAAADAALASSSAATDPWIAADVQLCRALVAASRRDAAATKAAFDAAPPSRIVRVLERRVVAAFVAPPEERIAAGHALLADWTELSWKPIGFGDADPVVRALFGELTRPQ